MKDPFMTAQAGIPLSRIRLRLPSTVTDVGDSRGAGPALDGTHAPMTTAHLIIRGCLMERPANLFSSQGPLDHA